MALDRHVVGRIGDDHLGLVRRRAGSGSSRPPAHRRTTACVRRAATDRRALETGDPSVSAATISSAAAAGCTSPSTMSISAMSKPVMVISKSRSAETSSCITIFRISSSHVRLFGDAIVGKPERLDLLFVEIGDPQHRDPIETQQLRRLEPAMSGDEVAVGVDQNRIGPAVGLHRVGELADLLFSVRARIARVRLDLPKSERSRLCILLRVAHDRASAGGMPTSVLNQLARFRQPARSV